MESGFRAQLTGCFQIVGELQGLFGRLCEQVERSGGRRVPTKN